MITEVAKKLTAFYITSKDRVLLMPELGLFVFLIKYLKMVSNRGSEECSFKLN